ncbi:MAG TPA: PKD domain-containing protein [Gammaproteobacteria bacterium]|nr:PKD domain-containing protein [Gammaproteobacteria bacterium]
MKIHKLMTGVVAAAGMTIGMHAAHGGTLAPSLARLSAGYTRSQARANPAVQPDRAAPGPFSPHVNSAGDVQVYIHYRPGEMPSRAELEMLGAKHMVSALGVVQAWVPVGRLKQLSALAGVTRVGLPVYAIVRGAPGGALPRTDTCTTLATGINIDASGILAENVQPVRNTGVIGSGVKVGIISTGVDCLASSQTAGYLPSNVYVDPSLPGSGDEGTAMLELVHAVAPGAVLGFCGPSTTADFVTCYNDFAKWGANIISDDLGFPGAFFFNGSDLTGNFIQSLQTYAQTYPDISLVTSAGNDRQDYYQGTYAAATSTVGVPFGLTPSGYTPENMWATGTTGRTYKSVMNFQAPSSSTSAAYEAVTYELPASDTAYFMLTWDDPLNGPYDDLDLYLVDSSGKIVDASTYDQASDANYSPSSASWNPPAELVQYTNSSAATQNLKLIVMCYVCNQTSNLLVKLTGTMDGGGYFANYTDGGVYGHAAMSEEIAAAAGYSDTTGSTVTPESFSQTGPYTYGDWQNGTFTRAKPDITGIDGVLVSGAGGFGIANPTGPGAYFYGTSAASPNVASVLALLRSAYPTIGNTAAQWKSAIENNANLQKIAVGSRTASEAGAGVVDAAATANAIDPLITAAITSPTTDPAKVTVNKSLQFRAACIYSGTDTVTHNWNFGAGSGIADSSQLQPSVTYTTPGTYTVTFTCSDSLQSVHDTTTVKVVKPSSSGGGAFAFATLIGLLGLAGLLAIPRRH